MGMAASQARHISLVARKTNVEWEGQQINQARTALANKTASLFNQMLGMTVPDCPDTTDFTKVQYSYSDGLNSSTIDSYYQISNPDPDFNYVVTHSYYTDVYTGSMKKLNDPQVQFNTDADVIIPLEIDYNNKKQAYITALTNFAEDVANNQSTKTSTPGTNLTYDAGTDKWSTGADEYVRVTSNAQDDNLLALLEEGVFAGYSPADLDKIKNDGVYLNLTKGLVLGSDLQKVAGTDVEFNAYKSNATQRVITAYKTARDNFEAASATLTGKLTYVGNCPLTPIDLDGESAEAIKTELNQVVKDLKAQNVDANIVSVWNNESGSYVDGEQGTIFSFTLNNVTYYTTLDDLLESYMTGTGNNNIDGQKKLGYYSASYQSTKITKTEKALLETDGAGRFTSVKFEDDTVKYILNTETITDTEAYDNAMNQYYYEVQKYEKTIADINAKTEIIQNQDRTLELRLKQLDTEESALSNEIDAVKKVLKDNVEKSFKTFSE